MVSPRAKQVTLIALFRKSNLALTQPRSLKMGLSSVPGGCLVRQIRGVTLLRAEEALSEGGLLGHFHHDVMQEPARRRLQEALSPQRVHKL